MTQFRVRRFRLVALVSAVLLAGCVTTRSWVVATRPELSCQTLSSLKWVYPGKKIEVRAAWGASRCHGDTHVDLLSKNWKESLENITCQTFDEQQFRLELACEPACSKSTEDGFVTPLRVGDFTYRARMVHASTGEVHECSDKGTVVWPSLVALECTYEEGRYEYCDQRPLPTSRPWVRPVIEYNGLRVHSPEGLTLNGKTDGLAFHSSSEKTASVLEVGTQVNGTYIVDVQFGPIMSHYRFNVGGR